MTESEFVREIDSK